MSDLERVLRGLVELKRRKDLGFLNDADRRAYEVEKLRLWREAFKMCGEIAEPKP